MRQLRISWIDGCCGLAGVDSASLSIAVFLLNESINRELIKRRIGVKLCTVSEREFFSFDQEMQQFG